MVSAIVDNMWRFFYFLGPGGFVGVVAAAIAWHSLHTAAAVNIRNKRVDVIMGCNARYDALAVTKTAIVKELTDYIAETINEQTEIAIPQALTHEIDLYHRRYWGLKSDQVDYWLAGYVDPETFISWYMSTIDAIHTPVEIWRNYAGTARGGWDSVKSFHETTNKRLFQIVQSISSEEVRSMSDRRRYAYLFDLFREIETDERGLIKMLKRNDHERLTMDIFRANLPAEVAVHVIPHELRTIRRRALTPEKDAASATQP